MLESVRPGIFNLFIYFQYPEKDPYLSYSLTCFFQQISLSPASFYNVELLCRQQLTATLNSII